MPIGKPPAKHQPRGFTLIELLVVMSIVALLASLVAPRYLHALDRSKEKALQTSLQVMRDAIDQYAADKGRYPESLDDLTRAGTGRYLRTIPEDPFTGRPDTWVLVAPPHDALLQGAVSDVRSGAAGAGSNGRLLADW